MVLDPKIMSDISYQLDQTGHAFLPSHLKDLTTSCFANSIGEVVNIRHLLPRSDIPTIQTLRPRSKDPSLLNQYSGTYGMGEFPLHTDLAHWSLPPRYLMLRCKVGAPGIFTRLLAFSELSTVQKVVSFRRALFRPRHARRSGHNHLLSLLFSANGIYGFRWDPLFLIPMNESAELVAQFMSDGSWDSTKLISYELTEPGDTLIVDNWRVLHGRSSVQEKNSTRQIERAYLGELYS